MKTKLPTEGEIQSWTAEQLAAELISVDEYPEDAWNESETLEVEAILKKYCDDQKLRRLFILMWFSYLQDKDSNVYLRKLYRAPSGKEVRRFFVKSIRQLREIREACDRPKSWGAGESPMPLKIAIIRRNMTLKRSEADEMTFSHVFEVFDFLEAAMADYLLSSMNSKGRPKDNDKWAVASYTAWLIEAVLGLKPNFNRTGMFYDLCEVGFRICKMTIEDPYQYVFELCKTRTYRKSL